MLRVTGHAGLVDSFAHSEQGYEQGETIATGLAAAARWIYRGLRLTETSPVVDHAAMVVQLHDKRNAITGAS